MKATTETALVRQCLDYLAVRRITAWRSNNVGIFDPTRKIFRTFTGRKGVSDILGLLPPQGRLLAVECKVGRNKPTPEQAAFLADVNAAGGLGIWVVDVKQLIEAGL